MEDETGDLQADIEKLQHTIEEDRSTWHDYIDTDEGDSDDDDDALFIDLEKHASAPVSVASVSARSGGGRTTPSLQSIGSQPTTETQSVTTEQDDDAMFREVGVVCETLDAESSLPASMESCLSVNQAYQEVLQEHIGRVELELAENREAQRRLEEEATDSRIQQNSKKRFPFCTSLPYFKSKLSSTPATNEDVKLKRLQEEPDLDLRPNLPWYQRFKKMLVLAVTEDALAKLLQPLLSRRELEEGKLSEVGEKTEEWHRIKDKITQIDRDIELKRQTPHEQLLNGMDTERTDWMKIANITFQGRRSWETCRRTWQHSADPKLNHDPWSQQENEDLDNLTKEMKGRNWVYIAQQLGTGRTAFQCLQHYQQELNADMVSRPWTKEEDQQLIKVVEKCQQLHFNWNKVSQYMEGRSSTQCYRQFGRLDPSSTRGYWTEAEDAHLMTAVKLVGSLSWGRVKELVPGRTREQCRERWNNSLDPRISGKQWTYEEDKKLLEGCIKHDYSWVKIRKELPGRTDNQVLHRHRRLMDWKRKSEWFKKQSEHDRGLIQGNNLPAKMRKIAKEKNWTQFAQKFAVYPEDYLKQQKDIDNGKEPVPRPPLMIGLATKNGGKTWERRIQLHRTIEGHINKLREKYTALASSVPGVFQLQDAISQLSQDCIAQRDKLMNQRQLGRLMSEKNPSQLCVKDLLAMTRGGKVNPRTHTGATGKRPRKGTVPPRLQKQFQVDSELRTIVRRNHKNRSMKKGRPRRFFWDQYGDQKMTDGDMEKLKATTISLYMKSLGADHIQLLKQGRRTFPERFRQLQAKRQTELRRIHQLNHPPPPPSPSPSTSGVNDDEDNQTVRRSDRQRKMVKKTEEVKEQEDTDPFSLVGQPGTWTEGFSAWQKQKDYDLLEWLARLQGIDPLFDPEGERLSTSITPSNDPIPSAGSVEVRSSPSPSPFTSTSGSGSRTAAGSGGGSVSTESLNPGSGAIGHGMSLVHASIQQALEEEIRSSERNQDSAPAAAATTAAEEVTVVGRGVNGCDDGGGGVIQPILISGGGDAHNAMSTAKKRVSFSLPSAAAAAKKPRTTGSGMGGGGDASNTAAGSLSPTGVAADTTAATTHSLLSPSDTSTSSSIRRTSLGGTGVASDTAILLSPSPSRQTSAARNTSENRRVEGGGAGEQGSNPRPPRPQPRELPNLPPTASTLQSFKSMLVRRLGLIKNAGNYYNLQSYLQKKDQQLAQLINAGNPVHALQRGTIDLSRMMNRVSQETNFLQRKKHVKRGTGKESAPDTAATQEAAVDTKEFDSSVLEAMRQTHDYKQLEARFQALFTWPAVLSAVYPPFVRTDFQKRAGDSGVVKDPNAPHARQGSQLAMIKSKSFYRFANKSKEEKEALVKKREEKRILDQVRELLADEDDPNPEVTMDPDSDDDTYGQQHHQDTINASDNTTTTNDASMPTAGHSQREDSDDQTLPGLRQSPAASTSRAKKSSARNLGKKGGNSRAKESSGRGGRNLGRKYGKRFDKTAPPSRQSSRVTERKHYTQRINKAPQRRGKPREKPSEKPDKLRAKRRRPSPRDDDNTDDESAVVDEEEEDEEEEEEVGARKEKSVQRPRKAKYYRNNMINAMVNMTRRAQTPVMVTLGRRSEWNPGGYVSDETDQADMMEMEEGGGEGGPWDDWIGDLPADQRDTLAQLERHSIVDKVKAFEGLGLSPAKVVDKAAVARGPSHGQASVLQGLGPTAVVDKVAVARGESHGQEAVPRRRPSIVDGVKVAQGQGQMVVLAQPGAAAATARDQDHDQVKWIVIGPVETVAKSAAAVSTADVAASMVVDDDIGGRVKVTQGQDVPVETSTLSTAMVVDEGDDDDQYEDEDEAEVDSTVDDLNTVKVTGDEGEGHAGGNVLSLETWSAIDDNEADEKCSEAAMVDDAAESDQGVDGLSKVDPPSAMVGEETGRNGTASRVSVVDRVEVSRAAASWHQSLPSRNTHFGSSSHQAKPSNTSAVAAPAYVPPAHVHTLIKPEPPSSDSDNDIAAYVPRHHNVTPFISPLFANPEVKYAVSTPYSNVAHRPSVSGAVEKSSVWAFGSSSNAVELPPADDFFSSLSLAQAGILPSFPSIKRRLPPSPPRSAAPSSSRLAGSGSALGLFSSSRLTGSKAASSSSSAPPINSSSSAAPPTTLLRAALVETPVSAAATFGIVLPSTDPDSVLLVVPDGMELPLPPVPECSTAASSSSTPASSPLVSASVGEEEEEEEEDLPVAFQARQRHFKAPSVAYLLAQKRREDPS